MNKKHLTLSIALIVAILLAGLLFVQKSNDSNNESEQSIAQNNADLIEIFYLSHAPAQEIIQQIEPIIAKFPQYTVEQYDFEDPANDQLVERYGIIYHLPIAIYINGENTFTVDGEIITLENFPEGDAFVPSAEGDWSYEDLEKILNTIDDQIDA